MSGICYRVTRPVLRLFINVLDAERLCAAPLCTVCIPMFVRVVLVCFPGGCDGLHGYIASASTENPVEALPPGVGLALTLDMEARDSVSG